MKQKVKSFKLSSLTNKLSYNFEDKCTQQAIQRKLEGPSIIASPQMQMRTPSKARSLWVITKSTVPKQNQNHRELRKSRKNTITSHAL